MAQISYTFRPGIALLGAGLWILFTAHQSMAAGSQRMTSFSLAGVPEPWTENWRIEDTLVKSGDGLKAGFFRRLPANLPIRLPGHTQGLVCFHPPSRHRAARLAARNVKISHKAQFMIIRASALKKPRGHWVLDVRVNDESLTGSIEIKGDDGWQVFAIDLSSYVGRSVDIDIEARVSSPGRASSAFIDFIEFSKAGESGHQFLTPPDKEPMAGNQLFDEHFNAFLELLRKNEEVRHFRMIDRQYMDRLYEKKRSKHK